MDIQLEPTADKELKPVTMREPEPEKRTVPVITLEPEPHKESDHRTWDAWWITRVWTRTPPTIPPLRVS